MLHWSYILSGHLFYIDLPNAKWAEFHITLRYITLQISGYRDQEILVGVAISVFGFFGFAIYPLCLELSVECVYPVAEATTAGFLLMSGYEGLIILGFIVNSQTWKWVPNKTVCNIQSKNYFTELLNLILKFWEIITVYILSLQTNPEYCTNNSDAVISRQSIGSWYALSIMQEKRWGNNPKEFHR